MVLSGGDFYAVIVDSHREVNLPNRWQGLLFGAKAKVFQMARFFREFGRRPEWHPQNFLLSNAPVIGEAKAGLWSQLSPREFSLTAGKVENLRKAALALNGVEIEANKVFSFWRQIGQTTKRRGYTVGRELREGCLVPNRGGGLCQITGLLYQAALDAGLEIVERHAHSRLVPGSMGEKNLDATVFWNYVDLRFRADFSWRLEAELDATDLIVRIRADRFGERKAEASEAEFVQREAATGDCLTCDQTACFRHPSATAAHAPGLGHSAYLLDARWPEFETWCAGHSQEGDQWLTPLDGRRFGKENYAWNPPASVKLRSLFFSTLFRSLRQRRLPVQGADRQKVLLKNDAALAKSYARKLSPECRHLVVSQNLLPHLWRLGVMGGRTFDVLLQRWSLEDLQARLDEGARKHPESPTFSDFRVDSDLLEDEKAALARAGRLITPHRALAKHFGHRSWLVDWQFPEVGPRADLALLKRPRFLLPCSPLGRKGIYELTEALRGIDADLLVLGSARENFSESVSWKSASLRDLPGVSAVVLPAWVEHQPRIALRALAMGIPVIATAACGLPEHPLLREIEAPDAQVLAERLLELTLPGKT